MPSKSKSKKSYTVSGVMRLSQTYRVKSRESAISLFWRTFGIMPTTINGRKVKP